MNLSSSCFSSCSIIAASLVLALSGCATDGGFGAPAYPSAAPPIASTSTVTGYGVVQAVELVPREQAAIGIGTVAGAVVGGIVGNQIGQGRGNTAATVAGVAGGALAGRELERRNSGSSQVYRITVQMRDGSVHAVTQETEPTVRIGDRVRLSNGIVERA